MKNLHIENSYNTWSKLRMITTIMVTCKAKYDSFFADKVLNRSYKGMYIEWWLHNIGYWVTRPFTMNVRIARLNERFMHLDLEEHVR